MDEQQLSAPAKFEAACAAVERSAAALEAASTAALHAGRALRRAASDGDVAKLRDSADKVRDLTQAVLETGRLAATAWPFSADEEEAVLKTGYDEELLAAARNAGLKMNRHGDRLAAFPLLISLLPAQRALRIDGRRVTSLRPSRVVDLLRKAQGAKPRLKPESFIETLFKAYSLVLGHEELERGTTLLKVYDALTVHPEMRRTYTRPEYVRDLYLLDTSGTKETKSGHQLRLTAATATRSNRDVLTIVGPDGETHTYYGIRFQEVIR